MSIEGLDIPSLLLDPQNEEQVKQDAYDRIRAASSGQITDFNPSSPVAALIEGQTYVYMELLWYLNMLPEALALEVLRLSGVKRSPGTKATGSVHFLLQAPISTDFIVSAGYVIPYKDAGFETQATLVIPTGAVEGVVDVQAIREGYDLNCPSFAITSSSVNLTFVQSIFNPEAITGGSDVEPLTETLVRAQRALRSRDVLVSVDDYQEKAQELLGFGSTATALPLISSNKVTEKAGHVHVFLADTLGQPPSTATCQDIQSQLQRLSFAGSSVWVSPVNQFSVSIDVVVGVAQISQAMAETIDQVLTDYLLPRNFNLGASIKIKELEYVVRNIIGVTEVVTLKVNGQAVNQPMPTKYTAPSLQNVTVTMVDPIGQTSTVYLGAWQYND